MGETETVTTERDCDIAGWDFDRDRRLDVCPDVAGRDLPQVQMRSTSQPGDGGVSRVWRHAPPAHSVRRQFARKWNLGPARLEFYRYWNPSQFTFRVTVGEWQSHWSLAGQSAVPEKY